MEPIEWLALMPLAIGLVNRGLRASESRSNLLAEKEKTSQILSSVKTERLRNETQLKLKEIEHEQFVLATQTVLSVVLVLCATYLCIYILEKIVTIGIIVTVILTLLFLIDTLDINRSS